MKLEVIKERYSGYLDRLEEMLEEEARFFNIPTYLIKGKRLRALISHISGMLFENDLEDTLVTGYALEMVHAASLIHDDIVDDAEIRRGGKTLNRIFNTRLAVLMGDILFTKSLTKILDFPGFYRNLSFAVYNMSVGQYYEDLMDVNSLDEDRYLDIIYRKTAVLYEIAFETGMLLKDKESLTLREAGKMFGLSFQILDDCDDFQEDEGKPNLVRIYQRLGFEDPLEATRRKAVYFLNGSEWNLRRFGVFENFADLFEYMWSRIGRVY